MIRHLLLNLAATFGLATSLALLATSRHWWQAVLASGLCSFFSIQKVRFVARAWKSIP